ncbi:MAG TPA: glycosyltransferase family 2 protein [Anaerolineales bacterium]|nr:glycosyltransferase family 2 protein [Anaerolineales bacterium]
MSTEKYTPLVSVLIVNWNAQKYLPQCLTHLYRQNYPNFETLLVDNASTDGSPDWVAEHFPQVRLICSDKNLGFAEGNNLAASYARGEWLALLNPDAFVAPDWLTTLIEATQLFPQYDFFSSQLLQALSPEKLDGMGDILHVSGLAWRCNYNLNPANLSAHWQQPREVFGACAAAALYRASDFHELGGFYVPFFSYHEDVDLSFRLRLRGKRCLHVPQSVALHIGSGTTKRNSPFQIYHGHRNLVWSYVQNMPTPLLWKYLPIHLLSQLVLMALYTVRGPRKAIWQAKWDAIRGLKTAWQVRKAVQATATASAAEIERVMARGWLEPFLGSRFRRDKG